MLLQTVAFLLLLMAPTVPSGFKQAHYDAASYESDAPGSDSDGADWGTSPWIHVDQRRLDPPPPNPQQQEAISRPSNEMSPDEAATLLAGFSAAAAAPSQDLQPTSIGLFTGAADMSGGFLDTASDAAAQQFMAIRSPADWGQERHEVGRSLPIFVPPPAPAPPLAAAPEDQSAQAQAPSTQLPPPAPEPSAQPFSFDSPPVMPPAPVAAAAALDSSAEAQLPSFGYDDLGAPPPAPPFVATAATEEPPAVAASDKDVDDNHAEDGAVTVSLMSRGLWKSQKVHQKVSLPTEPQVPPATFGFAPALSCDPQRGLEPTDSGTCVCMQGYGTNADMQSCAKCPVGWYSRGGQVGIVFCKPCPQLSTSNPSRTACVARRSVIRPDVAKSICELCVNPSTPYLPPSCCPRGQVCCGKKGCCPTKRCINNATTNYEPFCCGDDCNYGSVLNCCPGRDQICVNVTGQSNQICCAPGKVCGPERGKSCCGTNQECCNNAECCNTAEGATPRQNCAQNNFTSIAEVSLKCCNDKQINCNGTCCRTLDTPPTQQCFTDATGRAQCCDALSICSSAADGISSCCAAAQNQVCTRNVTTAGQQIARCCPANNALCPKNSFQPICCPIGRCPSPSTPDNCLAV